MGSENDYLAPGDQKPRKSSFKRSFKGLFSKDKSNDNSVSSPEAGDLPPPYSPQPPPAFSPSHVPRTITGVSTTSTITDDDYAYLREIDTVFLIDNSTSMTGSRWKEVESCLNAIVPICTEHDTDGVDVYFLNGPNGLAAPSSAKHTGITRSEDVKRLFRDAEPNGGTPIGKRLGHIMNPYISQYERAAKLSASPDIKPLNIIIITDGRPTDEPEQDIMEAAKRLDAAKAPAGQLGIQFFQVGNDRRAYEYLRALDDDLHERHIRDMVDTTTFDYWSKKGKQLTGDNLLKAVLGAMLRRIDNQRTPRAR